MTGNERLKEEKVFKDPVHRYIHVRDQLVWDLIGTKEFQRLRRIRQLGTTFLTFHGAEHTRFNHSLGVYEIMRRMIDVFHGRKHWMKKTAYFAYPRHCCMTSGMDPSLTRSKRYLRPIMKNGQERSFSEKQK